MRLTPEEINELTLTSQDARTLLWELLRKLTESLQGQVSFLVSLDHLPSVSWSVPNLIEDANLITLQEQLKTLLREMDDQAELDENQVERAMLAVLPRDLSIAHWEIHPLSNDWSGVWLIFGSTTELQINENWNQTLQTALSLALKTAQLRYEVEKSERYKRLQQKVTEVIHNSQELETILQSAIAHTTQALRVTRGIVLMLRYAEPIFTNRQEITSPNITVQLLTQWAQTGATEANITSFRIVESPLFLQAWQQAPTPLALTEQAFLDEKEPPFLAEPFTNCASLITPLMGTSSDRPETQMVLGFLLLQNEQPRHWSQEEQEVVSWVSTEASTAIIHNKTLQRVQSLVDERTAQLQRSLDVQAKLYETSRHQVQQLQQLNELKDEFLATISHELNTPLATMKMAIQMLRRSDLSSERRERYLNILEQEWEREHNLIKDLLTLQKIENEGIPLQVEAINLQQLLTQAGEAFQNKWENKGLNYTLTINDFAEEEHNPKLYSDAESVRRIFLELLSNAGKYSTRNTTVDIVVSELPDNWLQVSITNIGYGIAAAEQDYIFERFRRGKGATQKAIPGTGLGLALVKSLVQHLHGKIDLNSEYNPDGCGETTFHVRLPRWLTKVSSEEENRD